MPFSIQRSLVLGPAALFFLLAGCAHRPLISRRAAEQEVLTLHGLERSGARVVSRELVPAERLRRDVRASAPLWKVRVANADFRMPYAGEYVTNAFVHSLNVYYSPARHQVVEVDSIPADVSATDRPGSIEPIAEPLLPGRGGDVSLPAGPPRFSFGAALARSAGAYFARAIAGEYVLERGASGLVRTVWIVHALDLAPSPFVTLPQPRHMRSSIDAETGEWYYTDSVPERNTFALMGPDR